MSSRREQQADQTRRDILAAARRLFAQQGYKATRMSDIAEAANVSPQTIYDSIGSKATIATSLMDGMEVDVGLHELIPRIVAGDEPHAVIAAQVEISRRFVDTSGDLLRTMNDSGEPELRAMRAEGRRRHRYGVGAMVGRLGELGALRQGLDLEPTADLMAALTDAELLISLIDNFGWTLDDAAAATRRIVERELLADV